MLNSEYEITVGEHVYIYFSENQIYKIPLTDVNQILAFRSLEKGDDGYVPKDIITPETELFSAYKLVKKKKRSGGGGGGFTGCVFDLYYEIVGGFNCEPMKRGVGVEHLVSYVDNFQSIWNTSVNTNWTINWGDGSATSNADNQWHYNFTHTYPGPGTYTITITASYIDPCGNSFVSVQEQHTETIEVTDNTCSNANHNIVAHNESSEKRMTSELWVKHDFFGEHQVAETKSYEWKDPFIGSAGWYEEDAYVKAEIYWTFRDSECNVEIEGGFFFDAPEYGGLETDWCNSCQYKRAAKTIAGEGNLYVSDDEVHSHHKVVNEGIVLERNLIISTCN